MNKIAVCLAIAVAIVASCTSGDPAPAKDAPASTGSGFGATCVTVTDTASTECMSGVCTNTFDMLGHAVCSQKCAGSADGSSCPAGSDGMQKCNMKGYCKP